MSNRKASKSFKEKQDDSIYKLDSYDPKIRILQYNLVYVTGIPWDIASKQVLKGQLYFGRYGQVEKCIINPPCPYRKGQIYQAYATYTSELDASIAIAALDGFQFGERPMKVSYGTSKYCSFFLKNRQCTNPQCFYLHQFDKEHEVINGDSKLVFKTQNERAVRIVKENLSDVVDKIIKSKNQDVQEGFPSMSEMMQYLIDIHEVRASQYDLLMDQKTNKKFPKPQHKELQLQKNHSELQKKSQKASSLQKNLKQTELQVQNPSLIKNQSISTMCSPNKKPQSTQIDIEQNYCEQKQNVKYLSSQNKNNQSVKNREVQSEQGRNESSYQRYLQFDNIQQDKITQRIVKQILKKKTIRSRFEFVQAKSENSEFLQEAKKVKNIIQRVLITYQ